ncbi:NAD(P)/FAD-dependent oxidoreductase [Microbacterium sp. BK668]|uniref:NAD(P)/FAD-dependent oxidoreductase n=1 Tax=Microbacterium sp. BK668 TaxID=2512118 RepID=UPI00105FDDF3|nr:NAD(P)/FAD-dependent oxidoreductase [Microbacterium sp. BK668]TDN91127.1 thioredoxin reductase [Microbacterium sp. BK668]
MRNSIPLPDVDAVVIGGGPAGLQAGLTLARMHRRTVLFDSGRYRNETVAHSHNLLTNDGRSPAELRRIGREELSAYDDVEVRDDEVMTIEKDGDGRFVVTTSGGSLRARSVVLATGMRDVLPAIPGLAEAWGREVAQCPFCHGHEYAGRVVALLADGEHARLLEAMLRPIVADVVALSPGTVRKARRADGGMVLTLTDGGQRTVDGVFVAATSHQSAPFAAQLGCRLTPSGGIEIDAMGRTSVPGVYAGGDLAHVAAAPGPLVSLAAAIAAGQLAAATCVRELAARDLGDA